MPVNVLSSTHNTFWFLSGMSRSGQPVANLSISFKDTMPSLLHSAEKCRSSSLSSTFTIYMGHHCLF
jgi:hypothetical protein